MSSQPNFISEEELAQRIIVLHKKGLGVRRISKTLKSEGIDKSKDQVWRFLQKYAPKANEEAEGEQCRNDLLNVKWRELRFC